MKKNTFDHADNPYNRPFSACTALGEDESQSRPPCGRHVCIPPYFSGHNMHEPPLPLGLKLITDSMQINVIAELTRLTQENIRQLLILSPPPAILEAYSVSPETFRTAMDKQIM